MLSSGIPCRAGGSRAPSASTSAAGSGRQDSVVMLNRVCAGVEQPGRSAERTRGIDPWETPPRASSRPAPTSLRSLPTIGVRAHEDLLDARGRQRGVRLQHHAITPRRRTREGGFRSRRSNTARTAGYHRAARGIGDAHGPLTPLRWIGVAAMIPSPWRRGWDGTEAPLDAAGGNEEIVPSFRTEPTRDPGGQRVRIQRVGSGPRLRPRTRR